MTRIATRMAAVAAVMAIMVASCGKQDGGETAAPAPAAPVPPPAPAVMAPAPPPAAATTPAVTVQPMHSEGSLIRYPRISGLADAATQTKVNAIFAAREKQAAEDREGCFDLVRDAGGTPTDANFSVKIDVRYVSAHYVSLEIRRSYSCAGPYPTDNMPEPMTFDLTTGDLMNWARPFKAGFVPHDNFTDAIPGLSAMYVARYQKDGGAADPECKRIVAENGGGVLLLRLDARKGLGVQPDYPHAMAACADELFFTPEEIAPYVQDAGFLADLRATVHP